MLISPDENESLFPGEFRLSLLAECLHSLFVIVGQYEHALTEALEIAAGMHVGVEAEVSDVLAHSHREWRLGQQHFARICRRP